MFEHKHIAEQNTPLAPVNCHSAPEPLDVAISSSPRAAHWTGINLHVVAAQGPDGVDDLLHLVVDHAVQLAVADSVSVHDDAGGVAVVEPFVLLQRRWRREYNRVGLLGTGLQFKVKGCGTNQSERSSVRP